MVLCCLLFNLDADPTNCVFVLTRGHFTSASEAAYDGCSAELQGIYWCTAPRLRPGQAVLGQALC